MHESYGVYVTRVIDGDTFVGDVPFHVLGHVMVLRDQHFRLDGINAPEIRGEGKEFGFESKAYLEKWIDEKQISVKVNDRDKYGRWLATVFVNERNVNEEMVDKGFAERRGS